MSRPRIFKPPILPVCIMCTVLLVSLPVYAASRGRQDEVRPSPSFDLPILELMEPEGEIYDPKPEDMNSKELRKKLGTNFDSKFMSDHRPRSGINVSTYGFPLRRNRKGRLVPVGKMPKEIRKLRLNQVRLPDGGKAYLRLGKKMQRKLKEWLWAYTYCPVVYRWKDLGIRFWPRWIREGACFTTAGSCSFPLGMKCKARKSTDKRILRWHCYDWDQQRLCQWLPVRYPIITECMCSC